MKSVTQFLFATFIAFLPTVLSAQIRTVDLQVIISSPKNGDTYTSGKNLLYQLTIKNNGPDSLRTIDSVAVSFTGVGATYYSGSYLPAGGSVVVFQDSAKHIGTAPDTICFLALPFNRASGTNTIVDPDTLNNKTCNTIYPTAIANVKTNTPAINIYPNPAFASTVTLAYTSVTEGDLLVQVMDISGKQVRVHNYGKLSQGSNKLSLDLSGLQKGMYFIEVQQGNSRTIDKLLVQ